MSDPMIPTHIDFIKTYRDKNEFKGYWFLTWISAPGSIIIWHKTCEGQWVNEMAKIDYSERENTFPDRWNYNKVYAQGEVKKRLDSILEKHMIETNQIGEPYEYWKNNDERILLEEEPYS
jgi:hypothetical protein